MVACAMAQTRRRDAPDNKSATIATDTAAASPNSGQVRPKTSGFCAKDRRRGDAQERGSQGRQQMTAETGCREGTHEVADIVRRRPVRARAGVDDAVAQHQRQERRESEAPDAHGNGERDDTRRDDGKGAQRVRRVRRVFIVHRPMIGPRDITVPYACSWPPGVER